MSKFNREPFYTSMREGRMQPYTIWRGREVWQFCTTRERAEEWIAMALRWEQVTERAA